MRKSFDPLEILDTMMTEALGRGVIHHTAQDQSLDGRSILLDGHPVLNFGSCSYLGLELDERLKEGVIDAVRRYGTQFSSSRAYVSAPAYAELEDLLGQIFGGRVLATPSTTMAHQVALPVLIKAEDAVLFDQQVHQSVQMALPALRNQGTHVEVLRHEQFADLVERIEALRKTHAKVWYLTDGVYSMLGDLAPLAELTKLLNRYDNLFMYLDDAHGISWTGRHGCGYVLGGMPPHERLIVATSLNKSFAAAGGALVFFDPELYRKVRTCGGPMIFSGPIQPPMLGAAIASAKLHLSPEIDDLQAALRERILLCNRLMADYQLPVISPSLAPIRFVGMGLPRVVYNMVSRLLKEGMFTNTASFPAVPMGRSGLRFTLTVHHTADDIERLVSAIARNLPEALHEEGSTLEVVRRTFDLERGSAIERIVPRARPELSLQQERTITAIDRATWDRLLGARGTFDWEALRFLEDLFQGNDTPEENATFHYFLVRDALGEPILATFFTETLWKDDMLSPASVSRQVEQRRAKDPYFLSSRTLAMGSLLTEGEHLYLDREKNWQGALELLIAHVTELRDQLQSKNLVWRDLPGDDPQMTEFMLKQGFVKLPMPTTEIMELAARDEAQWTAGFTYNSRRHYRQSLAPWNDSYRLEVLKAGDRMPSEAEFAHYDQLYRSVKENNLELNPFALPSRLFRTMLQHPGWELVLLHLNPAPGEVPEAMPVAVMGAYRGAQHYCPMVIGLDYRFVKSRGLYRQCLRQVILRAMALDLPRIYFGLGSNLEKRRLGTRPRANCSYFQTTDHYHLELLGQFSPAPHSAPGAPRD